MIKPIEGSVSFSGFGKKDKEVQKIIGVNYTPGVNPRDDYDYMISQVQKKKDVEKEKVDKYTHSQVDLYA